MASSRCFGWRYPLYDWRGPISTSRLWPAARTALPACAASPDRASESGALPETNCQRGRIVTPAPPEVLKDFAPTGKLRAALNLSNIVLVQKDAATGEPKGITPELARELARRLGLPLELVIFTAAGKVTDALKDGAWD